MDSQRSSRPRRAAASRASERISSQYGSPFVNESRQPPLPRRQHQSQPPPRSLQDEIKDSEEDSDEAWSPRPPPAQNDNDSFLELAPAEPDHQSVVESPSQPSTLSGLSFAVAAAPSDNSLGSNRPTPSTRALGKRKAPIDVEDLSPSIKPGYPTVPSRRNAGYSLYSLDSKEGWYEKRVREKFETVTFTRPATAPPPTSVTSPLNHNEGDPFSFVYEKLDLQQERNYQAEVVEMSAVGLISSSGYQPATWQLHGRHGQDVRFFLRLKRDGFAHDEVTLICGKLVDALNRWPDINAISFRLGSQPRGIPRPLVRALFSAAQHSACPDKPLRFFAPRVSLKTDGRKLVGGMLHYIDTDTFEGKKHDFYFSPNAISPDAPVPDMPETRSILFAKLSSLTKPVQRPSEDGMDTSVIDLSDEVDENQVRRLRDAERLSRLCCAIWLRTKTPLKRLSEVKAFIKDMLLPVASQTRAAKFDSIDKQGGIWTSGRKNVLFRDIHLPLRLKSFVQNGTWPPLRIKSADHSWIKTVGEAATAVWAETGDLRSTWMAMARATDQVNVRILAGETPASFCACTNEVKSAHPCGMCGVNTPCASLQLHSASGLRACHRCRREFPGSGSASEMLVRLKITVARRNDQGKYGRKIDATVLNDSMQAMLTWAGELLKHEQGTSYPSQYTARRLQPPPQSSNPDNMSIDAVFPFGSHSGQVFIHCASNIALIPLCLNYLKHIHLPIFLSKVSVYYHQFLALEPYIATGQLQETEELVQIRRELVADCRQLAAIRRKVPLGVRDRMALQLSSEQLDYLKEEWVSGKLRPNSPVPRRVGYFIKRSALETPFRDDWETWRPCMINIIKEIEELTGVCLPRAYDGCPFFAHPDTIPSDWNWQTCLGVMTCRLTRLTDFCNFHWTTVDTPITIFLECIFQVSVGSMVILTGEPDSEVKGNLRAKYAEFLGLPLDIEYGNPLTFTVAHLLHGKQMRTGWPERPTKLMDRIDENNNILIETRASNYFKSNFHEAHYQSMKDRLLDVQLPLGWANAEVEPRPVDPELELEVREDLEDEDFDEEDGFSDLKEDIEDI